MPSGLNVAVFFDWQNCYRGARDAFGAGTNGNVNPFQLATFLARSRPAGSPAGELSAVDIYSGVPSQRRDPASYSARRRQHAAWEGLSPTVRVHTRTLVYRPNPVEKGIDVAIAIDLVRHVVFEQTCDVAILVSADTDLLPALELIADQRDPQAVEVAAWEAVRPRCNCRVSGYGSIDSRPSSITGSRTAGITRSEPGRRTGSVER